MRLVIHGEGGESIPDIISQCLWISRLLGVTVDLVLCGVSIGCNWKRHQDPQKLFEKYLESVERRRGTGDSGEVRA